MTKENLAHLLAGDKIKKGELGRTFSTQRKSKNICWY